MMIVDLKKCIGCGLCVKDCFPQDIIMMDRKANIQNISCIKCGHCIAICPVNAVFSDEYDMEDVKTYNKEQFTIDPDRLLNFIQFRRTVRQFQRKDVEDEKLLKIIEAGRFTQTGSNLQDVSYIIVKKGLSELKSMVLTTLKEMGEAYLSGSDPQGISPQGPPEQDALYKRYAEKWINMYEAYQAAPIKNDRLFFNAPAVIVVTAQSPISGGLASSNMELMTNALGLGTVFSGYFVRAARANKKIRDYLGVKEGTEVITCMVIGYPNVRYLRTVPRKKAEVSWK